MEKASFQAHLRYMLATDIAAFLFAALLVLIASRIRAIISPLAVVIVIAAFAIAFAGDVALWLYRGIRSIDLDEQTLTLFRGMDLKAHSFTRETVAGVEIKRRFLRRMVILRLSRIRAIRITEEAFPHEVFNNFLEAISGWGQRN